MLVSAHADPNAPTNAEEVQKTRDTIAAEDNLATWMRQTVVWSSAGVALYAFLSKKNDPLQPTASELALMRTIPISLLLIAAVVGVQALADYAHRAAVYGVPIKHTYMGCGVAWIAVLLGVLLVTATSSAGAILRGRRRA